MMKSISWILLVCLRSLIECPQKQEIEKLVSELQDQDKNIRYNAARALGLSRRGCSICRTCPDASIAGSGLGCP